MSQLHDLVQGSDSWHAFRLEHHGASEAAAMLGLSKHCTRTELLRAKHTGIAREFSDFVRERILDKGHEVEALARQIIERQLDTDLYPATYSDGKLSASCDGIDLLGDVAWENKQWNAGLAEAVTAGIVPDTHMPQCQQILMVTGAKRLIFSVSDGTDERTVTTEVLPDHTWFERIRAGWAQFEKDLAAYVPAEAVEPARAEPMESLPAVSVRLDGALSVTGNLSSFATALKAFVARIPAKPATDTEFATCDAACKALKKAEEALDAAEAGALASITDVEAMRRAVADCRKLARDTRLAAEKLVDRRKTEIKEQAVSAARGALAQHVAALNAELAPAELRPQVVDFGAAIKGLKSFASMQDALDTALAGAKITADAQAKAIRANLAAYKSLAAGFEFLFADLAQLAHKPAEDFGVQVVSRISAHRAAEAEKERKRKEAEQTAAATRYTEGQSPQQVLKAEPATADATDRGLSANASPVGGPMGAGQPAAAGPAGGMAYPPKSFRRAAAEKAPTPLDEATPAELRNEWTLFEHALEHVLPVIEKHGAAVDNTRFLRAVERMRAIFMATAEAA